jgi:miniconductance mechanosensitive channel
MNEEGVEFEASMEQVADLLPWLADYPLATAALSLLLLLMLVWLARLVAVKVLLKAVVTFAERSAISWDDILVKEKVFHRLIPVLPMLVLHWGILLIPGLWPELVHFIQVIVTSVIILLLARSLSAFLSAVNAIYQRFSVAVGRPIKGYIQVLQVLTYLVAGILIISQLMNKSPLFFLSGLGAMTAVLLLIFRDTLLSLVAGIQLTSNDLIRVGDWIEMPGFNADGDVVDIALNVVKVQNWDRTITVIPTHKFLEHSFKNWRGMFESGGRRIMRSLHIDMSTVRFLTPEEIEKFRRYVALKGYIEQKVEEIEQYNRERVPADVADVVVNRRALTNLGTFRAYITHYLRNHPGIHDELIFLIRQLEPTPQGLPLQIYVFTRDTRWVFYEGIQADIFDHLLAVLPEFGLRVYQQPSGADLQRLVYGQAEVSSVTRERVEG